LAIVRNVVIDSTIAAGAAHAGSPAQPRRTTMPSSLKSTLVLTTALTLALTSLDLRPASATPESGPAIAKQNAGVSEFSAARKRRRGRGVNPAIPLAAFGAIVGTIGGIAAEQRRRDYYQRYDDAPYSGGYVYQGGYGYQGGHAYQGGHVYQGGPAYQGGHAYRSGPPGYRGPYEPPGPPRTSGAAPAAGDRVAP
jgi:hypothetical protein